MELESESGVLYSPAHGITTYPNNLDCLYHIRNSKGGPLSLKFNSFDLDTNDAVQVRSLIAYFTFKILCNIKIFVYYNNCLWMLLGHMNIIVFINGGKNETLLRHQGQREPLVQILLYMPETIYEAVFASILGRISGVTSINEFLRKCGSQILLENKRKDNMYLYYIIIVSNMTR